jgi:YD repeat-containing protein
VIDLTHDQRGNVLTEKRTIGGQAYTVAYVYDKADRVTQITYPSGRIVAYVRAADGRISGVTTKQNRPPPSSTSPAASSTSRCPAWCSRWSTATA